MLPHLGQGANQSIEDGMALATILARADRANVAGGAAGLRAAAPRARGRRSSAARARTACATIPPMPDLGVRDAEIAAHAAFRRRLYDHDVVPEAEAAATALTQAVNP